MIVNLFLPAAWKQSSNRTFRIKIVSAAEFVARHCCRQLANQRVTDVFHFDSNSLVELFFERQDHQHPIDVAAQRSDSVPAPGPYLRADVVNDLEAFAMKLTREPHVEIWPVNQDDRSGAAPASRA